MITELVQALGGEVGRVELRGLLSTLRARWQRLGPGPARDVTAADGRALARAVERHELHAHELAAAVEVVRRWAHALRASDELAGRPECASGCRDRLLLVDDDGAARCALCDMAAVPAEVRA